MSMGYIKILNVGGYLNINHLKTFSDLGSDKTPHTAVPAVPSLFVGPYSFSSYFIFYLYD